MEVDPGGDSGDTSNATPWLAGMAMFGAAGLGVMGTRRWRNTH